MYGFLGRWGVGTSTNERKDATNIGMRRARCRAEAAPAKRTRPDGRAFVFYKMVGGVMHENRAIKYKMNKITMKGIILRQKMEGNSDTRNLKDRDEALIEEITQMQRILGTLLGFPELITMFCSVCLVSIWNPLHKTSENQQGSVYKRFHCGKRGYKTENLV